MQLGFEPGRLRVDGTPLLDGIGAEIAAGPAPFAHGLFLTATAPEARSRHVFELGAVPELERFTLCHRYEPYWMKPSTGERLSQVPAEAQWLLARLRGGLWLMLVPLLDEPFRFSLRAASGGFHPSGAKLDRLELLAETGDAFTSGHGGLGVFLAVGTDPFRLAREGARAVLERSGTGRLRSEKPLPDFVSRFGWCTWDAFYQQVNHEKVREGLASFAAGGVEPRYLILDDGWQSTQRAPTGEQRLVAFGANSQFPGGLGETVRMAKREFRIERFLVWHTLVGYWGGVDGASFPEYRVHEQLRRFGEGILEHRPAFNELWWGSVVGVVDPKDAPRFFDDYHASLAHEGVDGVKVDSQAVLEGVADRLGGRVSASLVYREALERSVRRHFDGRVIHCMSNGQESWYGGKDSTLLRSSIDFFPRFPETHGAHIYANAQVGVWFGEFMWPDWDMFQSGHEWGAFHAAARAVSGGPVYVSDPPGGQDFALLRKLVCSDGTVLRCDQPGLPTLDCLCVDPTRERILLRVWNRSGAAGIVGVFHCLHPELGDERLHADVSPRDVPGLVADEFACFVHGENALARLAPDRSRSVTLGPKGFELLSFVPIVDGFAALGLADKLNGAAAVLDVVRRERDVTLLLADGGAFVAYASRAPASVEGDGTSLGFHYDATASRLDVAVPPGGRRELRISW